MLLGGLSWKEGLTLPGPPGCSVWPFSRTLQQNAPPPKKHTGPYLSAPQGKLPRGPRKGACRGLHGRQAGRAGVKKAQRARGAPTPSPGAGLGRRGLGCWGRGGESRGEEGGEWSSLQSHSPSASRAGIWGPRPEIAPLGELSCPFLGPGWAAKESQLGAHCTPGQDAQRGSPHLGQSLPQGQPQALLAGHMPRS